MLSPSSEALLVRTFSEEVLDDLPGEIAVAEAEDANELGWSDVNDLTRDGTAGLDTLRPNSEGDELQRLVCEVEDVPDCDTILIVDCKRGEADGEFLSAAIDISYSISEENR